MPTHHEEPPEKERGGDLTRISPSDLLILPSMPAREQRRNDGAIDVTPHPATGRPADRTSAIPAGATASSPRPRPAPPSLAPCERCGGIGWLSPGPTFGRGPAQLIPCGCVALAAQRADRATRLGDELGELADRTFDSFRLSRPLKPLTWEGKVVGVAAQRTFLADGERRAREYAANPRRWLYLHGAFGAGKSHLAAAIANAMLDAGRSARFYTANRLLDCLTAAIKDGTTDQLLEDLLTCGLLVLDELAPAHLSEAASDWRFGRIERIVNERLSLPTVITANVAPDDLVVPGDLRAERVADRIVGVASTIWLPVSSYRRCQERSA